jgi:hypothetical protein
MTPAQCRAARGLLNWNHERLATAAAVDRDLLTDFEDERPVARPVVGSIQRAFERAGIEFTRDGGQGVRLRPEPRVLSIDELNASNDE